jgi:hypothetical protein
VIDALKADPHPDRVLSVAATGYQPSDANRLVAGYQQLLGQNGVMATWINTKYKETLNPNLPMVYGVPSVDGYDGGVLPLRRYVELKSLFIPPEQNQPDALLRDQLHRIPSLAVLRLLGVKYLLADSIGDVTRDGVFYDLAGSVTLGPSERVRLSQIATLPGVPMGTDGVGPVASIGVVSSLEGAGAVPDGAPVARIALGDDRGAVWQGFLVAGRDTAEGAFSAGVRHSQPAPLVPAGAGGSAPAKYLARLPVDGAPLVRWVEIQSVLGDGGQRVRIDGLTLIGQSGAGWPLTVAGDDALRLVHRSDVKLYRNERTLPRTYLVAQAQVADSAPAALAIMKRPGYDPQQFVVLERDPGPPPPPRTPLRGHLRSLRDRLEGWLGLRHDPREGTVPEGQALPGSGLAGTGDATIVEETAEHLTLRAETAQPSVLVVRDTFFPGWSATVDGEPAPLWRADYLFRAVPVPAGTHVVELDFRSHALEHSLVVSLLAALATVALALLPSPRRITRAPAPSHDAGPDW